MPPERKAADRPLVSGHPDTTQFNRGTSSALSSTGVTPMLSGILPELERPHHLKSVI